MKNLVFHKSDTSTKQSILKVLAYFDCFSHPLLSSEIFSFLDSSTISYLDFSISLQSMLNNNIVFCFENFYSIKNNSLLATQRIKGNNNAQLLLPLGKRISKFLYCFPFVRGIGISGSLSKNIALENSDIDYFIITKKNRLWIARTMMHAFKKLSYITGSQHHYCMNYYIDEGAMQIEEKNIFTAMELITLLPVCGNGTMLNFINANNWAKDFYPNYKITNNKTSVNKFWLKKAIETILDNRFGNWMDNLFMKITNKRWKKKEAEEKLNIKGNRMGLSIGKHFSKPNPVYFQQKVLSKYFNALNEIGIKTDN